MEALLLLSVFAAFVIVSSTKLARKVFVISLVYNIVWLIPYEWDLYNVGRTVYWSDAEYYVNGSNRVVYSIFSYSWFVNNLSLIGLGTSVMRFIMAFIVSLVHAIHVDLFKIRTLSLGFLLLVIFNPFLTLPLTRLMKDAYFLLFLGVTFKLFDTKLSVRYLWLMLMFFIMPSIRPWSVVLPIVFLLVSVYQIKRFKLVAIILGLSLATIMLMSQKDSLIVWYVFITEGKLSTYDLGLFNRFLGLFRLLFSPGFYRLSHPENYFLYYVPSLLFSVGLGLLCNYFLLTNFRLGYFIRQLKYNSVVKYIYMYIILAILIYSFAYSGSVEFRIKASILFPLIYALFGSLRVNRRHLGWGLLKFIVILGFFSVYAA